MTRTEPLDALRRAKPRPAPASLLDPHGPLADEVLSGMANRSHGRDTRPVRRPRRRVLLVAALATIAALIGIRVAPSSDGDRIEVASISEAAARELVTDALERASALIDADTTSTTTIEEVGGTHRVRYVSRVIGVGADVRRVHEVDDDRLLDRVDPRGARRAETIVVDGLQYTPTLPTDRRTLGVRTPWVLDLAMSGQRAVDAALPPDLRGVVRQLEVERRIDARREDGGGVVIELTRPAGELQPIDNAMVDQAAATANGRRRDPDPLMFFASRAAHAGGPDTPVEVRITVSADGDLRQLRMRATYRGAFQHTGASPEVEALEAVHEETWRWRPSDASYVRAPAARDVTLVGFGFAARRGSDDPTFGVHGRLDQVGHERAKQLVRVVQRAQMRLRAARGGNLPASARREIAEYQRQYMRVVERVAALGRLTAAQLAVRDECSPYWPASGRAMPRSRAAADPEAAGWRCLFEDGTGGYTLTPKSERLEPFFDYSGTGWSTR